MMEVKKKTKQECQESLSKISYQWLGKFSKVLKLPIYTVCVFKFLLFTGAPSVLVIVSRAKAAVVMETNL